MTGLGHSALSLLRASLERGQRTRASKYLETCSNVEDRVNQHFTRRQCWDYRACGQSGRISSPSHKMTFSTSCCSSNNCRAPLPELPPENVTNNGLVCPACSTFSGCKDQPRSAMKCRGDETRCFQYTRSLNQKEYIFGCASLWYCNLRLLIGQIYRAKLEPVIMKNCTKASSTSSLPVENYLICKQCQGDLDYKCENYAKCAPEHDACVTTISQTIYGGYKRNIQRTRRCGSSAECDTAGIITTVQKIISRSTTCCYYDNCIPPLPTLPSESNETNGHICENCYIKEQDRCVARDHIACTGNATRCISYTEETTEGLYRSKEILHGCTHPSICDSKNVTVTHDDRTLQETKICGPPGRSSVHPPHLLHVCFIVVSLLTLGR
ncbi:uncharacterized protein LOC120987316 [Bufo bufo]|uniref:uncharacterized protein LOC120987316 n=1 Tax=Bufo bufo TaxID=8384 RepID=UPI001ABE5C52|nr:uncharacterized protein LOC120987316 [Bufo bufo]